MEDHRLMLEAIGLHEDEERVYRALVSRPSMTAREIAETARTTEREARRILKSLEDNGLVALRPGRPTRFTPAPPDLALEALVHRRDAELREVRQEIVSLTEEFRRSLETTSPLDVVEVITGAEAVVRRAIVMERGAENRVLVLDRPPHFGPLDNPEERTLLQRGIEHRVIYSQASLELPGQIEALRAFVGAGESARLLPDLPMKLVVVDNSVAIVPLYPTVMGGLAIHPSPLLDAIISFFELLWDRALPLRLSGEGATSETDGEELSEGEREILTLMAMGHKDEAIARRIGVTRRTIQRRITDLMERLDATNRYQAGLKAGLRGWY